MRSSSFFIAPVLALACISSTFAQERKENKENTCDTGLGY